MTLAEIRREYAETPLEEAAVAADPIEQFRRWMDDALRAELLEPTACVLATASKDGSPNARAVLLKGVDAGGFVFYTNYRSTKARELEENPRAALVFYWAELERQVILRGSVTRTSREEADRYFATRPRGSQIGAWASPQSEVIPSRAVLEERVRAMDERFRGEVVPRPEHWGGYRLTPQTVEFWKGRRDRLHDRLRYTRRADGGWVLERLAP